MSVGFRYGCPEEHGGLGFFNCPADVVESCAEGIPAQPVDFADFGHAVLGAFKGGDGCYLNGGEGAVIQIGLDAPKGSDQFAVADHEANPPAGHVVAFGQGEKFHGDIGGAWHLQDGRGDIAVEDDIGIGDVVHDPDFVFPGEFDHFFKEVEFHALGGRVAREVQDEHFGLGPGGFDGFFDFLEKVDTRHHGYMPDIGACQDTAVGVYGVCRIWYQYGIAGAKRCKHEVGQTFLGADGYDGLGVGVEFDAKAAFVPAADGFSEADDAFGDRITMGGAFLGDFDQLVDNVLRCGSIRVAHAKVDNVDACGPLICLEIVDDVENVGGQAFDALEFFHAALL